MSSPYRNPAPHHTHRALWARLIPGESPRFRGKKKSPQSAHRTQWAPGKVAAIPVENPARKRRPWTAVLLPAPLLKANAWRSARAVAADFALVALNWLLLGALLVPLRTIFPQTRVFAYAAGAPASLLGVALLEASLISLMGYIEGLYAGGDLRRHAGVLCRAILWATALLGLAYRLQGVAWVTGVFFCGVGALNLGALWAWRWQNERRQHRTGQVASDARNVLIVGASDAGRRIASSMEGKPEAARSFCGFLDDEKPLGDGVIGRIGDLARLARTGFVDEVILVPPHDRKLTLQILREAQRLRLNLEMVPELYGCKPAENEIEHIGDLPLIGLHAERLPAAGLGLKRLMDIVGASLVLMFLSPLLALIALLIKLDSSGPVLYRALRAGRKSKPFRCCKFRTMVTDADALKKNLRRNNERAGPFFKIVNDPRITRLGRFLRRYSLDELPQLWNVLQGDMSLVGPRPHPLDDLAAYEVEHLGRLDVTPGMTGLWQVTARRDPSFERGMELDREYIQTWSTGSDLRILLKTFRAVLQGSGD